MVQITKQCGCVVEQVELSNTVGIGKVTGVGESIVSECSKHQQERKSNLENIKNQKLKEIKRSITKLSIEKDKANSLGYADVSIDLQNEIDILQAKLTLLID